MSDRHELAGMRPDMPMCGWVGTVTGVSVCDVCVSDLLYCDRHDTYFCVWCDRWQERACTDPECPYCPGRPEKPSMCGHPDRHYKTHD